MNVETAINITPEQELNVLKLILSLRQLGDLESSEKMRSRIRRTLLYSSNTDLACAKVDDIIRHYTRIEGKLNGTYDTERERKRVRRERAMAAAARYVEAEAESGDEDEDEDEDEDDDHENDHENYDKEESKNKININEKSNVADVDVDSPLENELSTPKKTPEVRKLEITEGSQKATTTTTTMKH